MKLCVITSEFGAAANLGGGVETRVKSFELPESIAAYIRRERGLWTTVSLAFEDEDTTPEVSNG